jgi:hypothetical protein
LKEERITELENILQRVLDFYDMGDLVAGPDSKKACDLLFDDVAITLTRDYPDDDD